MGLSLQIFSARYYNKHVKDISIPRLWLCSSMELKKPYCEVCWLFIGRSLHNYESQRGWINGVDGTGRSLLGKIKRHETCTFKPHLYTLRGKPEKTLMKRMKNRYERTLVFELKFSIA